MNYTLYEDMRVAGKKVHKTKGELVELVPQLINSASLQMHLHIFMFCKLHFKTDSVIPYNGSYVDNCVNIEAKRLPVELLRLIYHFCTTYKDE